MLVIGKESDIEVLKPFSILFSSLLFRFGFQK